MATIRLSPGSVYYAGFSRPFFITDEMVRGHLEQLGASNVQFHKRDEETPPVDPTTDPEGSDEWDEWISADYLGEAKTVEEPKRWAWAVVHSPVGPDTPAPDASRSPSPSQSSQPPSGGLARREPDPMPRTEVPPSRTPMSPVDAAESLIEAWPKIDREQAALVLALVWTETGQGLHTVQNNPGNISANDTYGGPVWRPPWYAQPEPDAPEKIKRLHKLMEEGKAPKAFRAYDELADGFEALADLLQQPGYKPLLAAASTGDVAAFRAEVARRYSLDYTPAHDKGLRQFQAMFRPLVANQPEPEKATGLGNIPMFLLLLRALG